MVEAGPGRTYSRHKRRLFDALRHELVVYNRWSGDVDDALVVAEANGGGQIRKWKKLYRYEPYDLRTVLPTQVVFDLGDNSDWTRIRNETHTILSILEEWGVPCWCALTGGKGIHIEVFLRPLWAVKWRQKFADAVLSTAYERLGYTLETVDADPRLLAPEKQKRQLREFGAMGSRHRKTLWFEGVGGFPMLPFKREEAYKARSVRFPSTIFRVESPPGTTHAMRSEAEGGQCPRRPACYDKRPGDCSECPLNDFRDVFWAEENL